MKLIFKLQMLLRSSKFNLSMIVLALIGLFLFKYVCDIPESVNIKSVYLLFITAVSLPAFLLGAYGILTHQFKWNKAPLNAEKLYKKYLENQNR